MTLAEQYAAIESEDERYAFCEDLGGVDHPFSDALLFSDGSVFDLDENKVIPTELWNREMADREAMGEW
jgi:hypothetical protein